MHGVHVVWGEVDRHYRATGGAIGPLGALIRGLRRTSRPGRRVYVGHRDIPKVHNGMGIAIMSTSRGVLTDEQARRAGIGGEVLCEVW